MKIKRKVLSLMIFLTTAITVGASNSEESYLPILEIGKEWTYANYAVSGDLHESASTWTWEAINVEEKDRHQIFTLILKNDETDEPDIRNEYEEEGVLWAFSYDEWIYQPMIDFKLEVGDMVGYREIIWKGPVDIEGIERCVMVIGNSWTDKLYYWIEGIGAVDDVYLSPVIMPIGERTRMTECRMGNTCLFDFFKLDEYMVGVDLSVRPLTDKERSAPCYDIYGRYIVQPTPGQLYIQGGRKHIAK